MAPVLVRNQLPHVGQASPVADQVLPGRGIRDR